MNWSQFRTYLGRLIAVPKCVMCKTRLPLDHPNGVLCPVCHAEYESEKQDTCPVCASRMADCFCVPPWLPKTRARRMVKLVTYRRDSERVSAHLIYALKHRDLIDLQRFLARELSYSIASLIEDPDEWLVSYPPRSRASIHKDGFDHAAETARALGTQLGIPFACLLSRSGPGKIQKSLTRTERMSAAREAYTVIKDIPVKGKRVILFDDICTTGATLVACATQLYRAGVKEVVFATVAITPPHRNVT